MRIGPDSFAVITGGAGGIGSALAAALSSRGASVALIDVDRAGLDAVCAVLPRCAADARLIDAASRVSPALVQLATRRFWRRIPFL